MGAAIRRTVLGLVTAASALAVTGMASAQDTGSVSDYRLPEPTRTARPPVIQGPVDPENPIVTPSSTPRAERVPTPAPTPSVTLPAIEPTSRPARPAAEPRARPTARPSAPPSGSAAADVGENTSTISTPSPSFSSLPTIDPEGSASQAPEPVPAPQATASKGASSRWIAGAFAVLLFSGAAAIFLRRRKPGTIEEADAPPVHAAPDSPPTPTPPPPAAPSPVPIPAQARKPEPLAAEALELTIVLMPQAIRLSLVYATLQYQLDVRNTGSQPLPTLQVRGDLASAHASLSTVEQLAPAPAQLEVQGSVQALAPGEGMQIKGEVRVPLSQVRPFVKGSARFLVPLARFCLLAEDGRAVCRVFTLGPVDAGGAGAITPVRLDAGPRNLRELQAREVEAARAFTLDPVLAGS